MSAIEKPLKTFLSQFPQFKLAILFGSQAIGNANPDSDIDLAPLADAPISSSLKLEALRRCIKRIEDKRPATVDILTQDQDVQDILVLNLTRAVQLCEKSLADFRRFSQEISNYLSAG